MSKSEDTAIHIGATIGAVIALMLITFGFVLLTVGLGVIPLVAAVWGVQLPFWPTLLTVWLVSYLMPHKHVAKGAAK